MEELLDQIRTWRRHLHAIPEIGFQEYKTSKYLYEELEKMGYQPLKITETGIAVYLDFHKEKTLAFRSDIDALEIEEKTGVSFKSTHQGKMHACGHDGHMTALLGLAYKLKDVQDLPHNVLLIFQPGEEVRLKDLLYGVLLPSGAECCLAFADRISGSEEEFVSLMNDKAQELGMKNTHFTNSTGLHDPEHYSTVEDISILLQYALKNEYFRDAFTSSRYSTIPSEQHPEGFTFHSTIFKYMDSTEVTGGEILGGKTGYTEEAGLCLASLAQVNGKEYILVTAKANGTHQTEQFHILDAINVYNQIGEADQNTYD